MGFISPKSRNCLDAWLMAQQQKKHFKTFALSCRNGLKRPKRKVVKFPNL